jgi:cephalosporin hydroxylase
MPDVAQIAAAIAADPDLRAKTKAWLTALSRHKYVYQFTWMGVPVIQAPQDIVALQELVWKVRPQVVVETGVAHGGSLIFYASMLRLLGGEREVIGIDIDIRDHNRAAIEGHALASSIHLVQGSSIDPTVVDQVRQKVAGRGPVMVILDSFHSHEHVLAELRAYAEFVTEGSYLVVLDTVIEDMPPTQEERWGIGNNPKTAVHAFLAECDRFEIDALIHEKLVVTAAPDGYLRCVRDP